MSSLSLQTVERHSDQNFPWSEAKEAKAVFHALPMDIAIGSKVKLTIKTINGDVTFPAEFEID